MELRTGYVNQRPGENLYALVIAETSIIHPATGLG
jgi:hypothetical protein